MKKIRVLGDGQLGAMLKHAAMPLSIELNTIDIHADQIPELNDDEIITVELEHWPDTQVTRHLSSHPNFLNRETLKIFADRAIQKRLLDSLNLPQAAWQMVESSTTSQLLYQKLGENVLLKRRSGGYDGKGQLWLDQTTNTPLPDDWKETSIAEEKMQFAEEVSIIGARNAAGKCVFFPVTVNLHYQGILLASVAPTSMTRALQEQAEKMLSSLMNHLDYIGVMAMECFTRDNQLFINEIAPRVHNSGHWTQAGASISQFEMHLRAITDLPLIKPSVKHNSVMINLLGMPYQPDWLGVHGAEVYWYGKQVRPMRKLGHLNLCLSNTNELRTSLKHLKPMLDDYYSDAIDWCDTFI